MINGYAVEWRIITILSVNCSCVQMLMQLTADNLIKISCTIIYLILTYITQHLQLLFFHSQGSPIQHTVQPRHNFILLFLLRRYYFPCSFICLFIFIIYNVEQILIFFPWSNYWQKVLQLILIV